MSPTERRHAPRVIMNAPTLIEVVAPKEAPLHPNLAAVYERVKPALDDAGQTIPGKIRDLSTNGTFINCRPIALLSRVIFRFELEGFGEIEALGWTMWRRSAPCEIPRAVGDPVRLDPGIGVLFEAVPLEARQAIAALVHRVAPKN